MTERSSRWPHNRRLQKPRTRFEGAICNNCEAKQFPERVVCPECGFSGILFDSKNKLTSNVIIIQQTPMPVEQVQG